MIKILSIVSVTLILGGCNQGTAFSTHTVTPDSAVHLEATGLDLRVYEFTPQTAPNKQCVFVHKGSKGGLTCFDKTS